MVRYLTRASQTVTRPSNELVRYHQGMAYDSKATQERILAAATAEFAAHGVAGARVDRIAAQAEANKRAIYDYFGDKDKLFAAVLERLLADLAQAVPPGDEDLPAYAERLFDH